MAKPKYYQEKECFGYPPQGYQEEAEEVCPDHPDLLLLRDAAADERDAIAKYLACAVETCLDEVFLDIAEDEMHHYAETMRLISQYDPVQAEMLEEEGLDFLVSSRAEKCCPKWGMGKAKPEPKMDMEMEMKDVMVSAPDKKDIPKICCLTEGLKGEFMAINKYQTYMCQAHEEDVKEHFCRLMNDEKEHVAELTAALFRITGEPLPEETD